jgi:branched-chain amino acid transport system substrate-binding protein
LKKLKKKSLFALLILLLGTLAACAGGKSEEAGNTTTTAEGDNTVVVGYSGPLSGAAAQYGINVLNGLEMAADEINETGFEVDGKTYKIKLVSMDDKYLPNETGVNVQRMATENDPVAVWIHTAGESLPLRLLMKRKISLLWRKQVSQECTSREIK